MLASAAAGIGISGFLTAAIVFARPLLQIAYGEEPRSAGVFVHAMALGTVTYLAAAVGFADERRQVFSNAGAGVRSRRPRPSSPRPRPGFRHRDFTVLSPR